MRKYTYHVVIQRIRDVKDKNHDYEVEEEEHYNFLSIRETKIIERILLNDFEFAERGYCKSVIAKPSRGDSTSQRNEPRPKDG